MSPMLRNFFAEAIGTAILVLGGCGTAVLATGEFADGSVGLLGVSLAFGISLLVMAYAIGSISGCHINPAVTVGLFILRRVKARELPAYILGQLVGGTLGALAIFGIATSRPGGFSPDETNFAVNGWGQLSPGHFDFGAMAIAEILLTAVLVLVVASTAHRKFIQASSGLAVGLTLALIHLISIPVTNTSVNPARSFGVALFAGGEAITQLWAFFVFPLVGAVVGALAWKLIDDSHLPDRT